VRNLSSKMLGCALATAAVLACLTMPTAAQTLPVPGASVMVDIPDAHEKPDPTLDYKIVFDMQSEGATAGDMSPGLKMIGTLINTYEKYGVTPDHLHLQAVFHGATILLVVDDVTYKARTGFAHNPNAELLQQLSKAGLKMVVCGQSAMQQHYDFKSILPVAQINLSASVTFINLAARGYTRITE
jgi:intracellular sulfur oxidation DsrE/DsrF family protein